MNWHVLACIHATQGSSTDEVKWEESALSSHWLCTIFRVGWTRQAALPLESCGLPFAGGHAIPATSALGKSNTYCYRQRLDGAPQNHFWNCGCCNLCNISQSHCCCDFTNNLCCCLTHFSFLMMKTSQSSVLETNGLKLKQFPFVQKSSHLRPYVLLFMLPRNSWIFLPCCPGNALPN